MGQNGSILEDTKKALGVDPSYDVFDTQLVMFINGVFSDLWSQGIGPEGGFEIDGAEETWADFLGDETDKAFNQIGTLVYIQVKLMFDVFAEGMTSYVIQSFERRATEIKFRMQAEVEHRLELARQENADAFVYLIGDGQDFPDEAPKGALGYDPKTGMFWRNQS